MARLLLHNCNVATMEQCSRPYGLGRNWAIVISDGTVEWVGPEAELPSPRSVQHAVDLDGALVTPGLLDCHTHIVFAGNRAQEFEQRLGGVSYAEIARRGGGIVSTMKATRAASEERLVEESLPRLDALLAEGVTTVEIKSGYGLSIESELRMLRAARRLAEVRDVSISKSWLAAHAVPPEYAGRADEYIDEVAVPGLDAACKEGLVDAVDGFCEDIAFDTAQIASLFRHAASSNLPIKLHGEQLTDMGAAKLAASFGAISVDHLEHVGSDGIAAMAAAGTVAVVLPGAFYTVGGSTKPPVDEFRKADIPMAVATDGNPGSSPMFSILLAMNMACTLFGLTPEEALAGTTRNAARALGMSGDRGTIAPNKRADLAVWKVEHPCELPYRIGFNPLAQRMFGGEFC